MVAGTEEGALDDLQTYIDLENDKLNDVLGSLLSNLGVADWHVLHMQVEA
jgi:hypothetical protein